MSGGECGGSRDLHSIFSRTQGRRKAEKKVHRRVDAHVQEDLSKQKPGLSSSHVLGARRKSGEGGGTWRGTSVAADGGAREGAKREGDRSIVALSKQGGGTRKTKLVFVSPFLRFFVPFVRLPSNKPLLGERKKSDLSLSGPPTLPSIFRLHGSKSKQLPGAGVSVAGKGSSPSRPSGIRSSETGCETREKRRGRGGEGGRRSGGGGERERR